MKMLINFVLIISLSIMSIQCLNPQLSSYNFTDKVVLTTGSSSGIGAGIAKLFAQLGAHVMVTGRKAAEIQSVANECQQLSPKKLKPLQVVADVSDDKQLTQLLNKTIETYGRLDVLVNNAGIGLTAAVTDPKFMPVFDKVISTNLRPYVQLSHLSVPYLLKTNGSIISISSIDSMAPMQNEVAYAVSKAGIDMMTRVLALELGPNIRVNTINPGFTMTNMQNGTDPDSIKEIISHTPLKRVGLPDDMAKGVAFLASDQASFITGANLVIDGGLRFD
ncbi:3-oxoacyl-[acyl-carrier-protein] reductase FabG-like [Oppia nitens]|uniref:3-oxoacyl-[acyl-carrier-protein] reductase FabG-like n=1 Tax=Oppia nitens TaxID=1686743 RepID=UPI0023DA5913|nr:3-oxoacyl-[acyl-carrier-protein] reductase FabG-like [Oppia nitens]